MLSWQAPGRRRDCQQRDQLISWTEMRARRWSPRNGMEPNPETSVVDTQTCPSRQTSQVGRIGARMRTDNERLFGDRSHLTSPRLTIYVSMGCTSWWRLVLPRDVDPIKLKGHPCSSNWVPLPWAFFGRISSFTARGRPGRVWSQSRAHITRARRHARGRAGAWHRRWDGSSCQ